MIKIKYDNDTINHTGALWFTPKLKLNYQDLSNRVLSMMKIKHDNDVTNHISAIYAENGTELSLQIGPSAFCDEN